ncbi:MAG: aromatic amino acid transport family protein [Desulfonatronovibrionaceae bacterium]
MEDSRKKMPLISVSFLVLGNCLGVGVLALPIKSGLCGFFPALAGIVLVWLMMLTSAFVIGYKINIQKSSTFDIPSFYAQETNQLGKWVAIACNLILLYGVLVAYLSGMTTIINNLIPVKLSDPLVTIVYFLLTTTLILFGSAIMRKGNMFIVIAVWISFIFLIIYGAQDFELSKLGGADWGFFPIGIPVAVSAFHFHNIIPTVSRSLNHDVWATRKAIFIGVGLGLVINLIWVLIVLGTLQRMGLDPNTIEEAYWHDLPATIPMDRLLHSRVFEVSGFVFAFLAVTASYIANGTGLFGFIRDMTNTYLNTRNKSLVAVLTFLPPLVVTLIYPDIFLSALDVVGGVGETILFIILPGYILLGMCRRKYYWGYVLGWIMLTLGALIAAYALLDKFGLIDLAPVMPGA